MTGNRYAAIYLRKARGPDGPVPADSRKGEGTSQPRGRAEGNSPDLEPWAVCPSAKDLQSYPLPGGRIVDLPGLLAEQEAVDAVAYSAESNRVRVRRKGGEVEFRQEGGPGADITVDLTPTLLKLLGRPIPPGLDGMPLPEVESGR